MIIWVAQIGKYRNITTYLSFSTFGLGVIAEVEKIHLILLFLLIEVKFNENE